MAKFYSPSRKGFYSHDAHGQDGIPGDAVEITDEEWGELLTRQSKGQEIVMGTHGRPIAADRDPYADLLATRDRALNNSDWLVARHRDEVDLGGGTTLSDDQFRALQSWRRILRNITSHPGFPRVSLPERPV